MNKREVKQFLESIENKALRKARDNKDQEVMLEATKFVGKCLKDVKVDSLFRRLKGLTKDLESITEQLKGHDFFKTSGPIFNSIQYLNNIVAAGFEDSLIGSLYINSYDKNNFNVEYKKNVEKIKKEFKVITANVSGMNGKEATDYLEKLGFEIPKKQPKIKNEILAPVDVEFIKNLGR